VGKTSIINRFCRDLFESSYKATIGIDFEMERFWILNVPFNLQMLVSMIIFIADLYISYVYMHILFVLIHVHFFFVDIFSVADILLRLLA